jgi:uncharacterized protein YecT (DUF1311 family)
VRAAGPVQTYEHCQEAANGITAVLMECDRVEDHRLNAEINNTYETLMVGLPEPRKTQLRQAQRDWLAFRYDECAFRNSAEAAAATPPWWQTGARPG